MILNRYMVHSLIEETPKPSRFEAYFKSKITSLFHWLKNI